MDREQFLGYLPDERPPALKLFLYALQQVIVMFPATIAVALITGFQVSTTIFASGIATVCLRVHHRWQDPDVLRLELRVSDGGHEPRHQRGDPWPR